MIEKERIREFIDVLSKTIVLNDNAEQMNDEEKKEKVEKYNHVASQFNEMVETIKSSSSVEINSTRKLLSELLLCSYSVRSIGKILSVLTGAQLVEAEVGKLKAVLRN